MSARGERHPTRRRRNRTMRRGQVARRVAADGKKVRRVRRMRSSFELGRLNERAQGRGKAHAFKGGGWCHVHVTEAVLTGGRLRGGRPAVRTLPGAVVAAPKPREVKVRCDAGETIGGALSGLDPLVPAVVQVSGTCRENVLIRGFNDLRIVGAAGATLEVVAPPAPYAIEVDTSRRVSLEDLTIQGTGDRVAIGLGGLRRVPGDGGDGERGHRALCLRGQPREALAGQDHGHRWLGERRRAPANAPIRSRLAPLRGAVRVSLSLQGGNVGVPGQASSRHRERRDD